MSGDLLKPDGTGGEREQFLPDLLQSLRLEERWKRQQNESQIGGDERRNGKLVGAADTSKECAEWHRLQRKNLSILACC